MGTNECSQPASKSSWDSQDFGDVNMVLKWPIFTSPLGLNEFKDWTISCLAYAPSFEPHFFSGLWKICIVSTLIFEKKNEGMSYFAPYI